MIPVSIVTGFLGSGKTTLIRRLLGDPAFGATAVIVNEFGEIGLDHELIASSDDSVLTLNTGCLCCAVQTDLARTLLDLAAWREAGTARYDRVLIETSGLADPAPMLQAVMTDRAVAALHRLDTVATVADAVHGADTLDRHAAARMQVALADRLLISKTDLRPVPDALHDTLRSLNADAPRLPVAEASAATLFGNAAATRVTRPVERAPEPHGGIETFTLVRERPLPALALTLLLQSLAEHCGSRLLRLKGIVALREMPGRPAVIHGVRHVVSEPEFLDNWPSDDRTTRMVFIGTGIPRHFPSRLLDAIEEEVREATAAG